MAAENLQARVRGTLLMGLSNQHGHLLLATSNKSEVAVGYSTLYGDAAGGFAPIKDVPKTLVWELARWRNAEAGRRGETEPIPQNSIDKPPSAELAPGQQDSDSLPSYEELDAVDRRLRRPRPRHGRAARARARPRGGGPRAPSGGHRGVQAPAVGAGNEDQPEGIRPGSAPADHQPLAGEPAQRPRRSGNLMSESVLYGGTSSARVRVHHLLQAKERGEKWAMLTAYDTVSASVFEEAGIPVLLVGDSAGNVVLGLHQHRAGHGRGHPVHDQGGHPVDEAGAGRRRHAVRQLRGRPRSRRWPPPSGS